MRKNSQDISRLADMCGAHLVKRKRFVSSHDDESSLTAKVWTEAASTPVCPLDAMTLHGFNIVDS